MTNIPSHYSWRPELQQIYQEVLLWIDEHWHNAENYREFLPNNRWRENSDLIWSAVQSEREREVAFTFFALFPAHYFKVYHTLDQVIGPETFMEWVHNVPYLNVLDIGCGTGAASVAFIETLVRACDHHMINRPIEINIIGLDPNDRAIELYNQLMNALIESLAITHPLIRIHHRMRRGAIPSAFLPQAPIPDSLGQERGEQPAIPHMVILQSNLIASIQSRNDRRNEMVERGIDPARLIGDDHVGLGVAEANAYRQMFETCQIDRMHIITIGTNQTNLRVSVDQLATAITNEFVSQEHTIQSLYSGIESVTYENPIGCFWRDARGIIVKDTPTSFVLDVQEITSNSHISDHEWQAVIELENLRLAWAKACNHLSREALVDEVELRLFERDPTHNLQRLRTQIERYVADIILTETEDIQYGVPKGGTASRPKALSRLEEEIISIAIIQQLGHSYYENANRSFAYRVSTSSNEYAYEAWFEAYMSFIRTARLVASDMENPTIINVDIEAFYTRIIQEQLIDMSQELAESHRVQWLLRQLLNRTLDSSHEEGRGLTQGDIGSGFFANIYLRPIDERFGTGNEWGLQFFRYADDMYLILPADCDEENVLGALQNELELLGLNLNEDKTVIFRDVEIFLSTTEADEQLNTLFDSFTSELSPLWILNHDIRLQIEYRYDVNDRWWDFVERYCVCLRAIDIYVTPAELSRQLYKYLFNRRLRQTALSNQNELVFSSIPSEDVESWAEVFHEQNASWFERRYVLQQQLVNLFRENWAWLETLDDDDEFQRRIATRRIRFAINRLADLGLNPVIEDLVLLIEQSPWLFSNIMHLLERIAHQDYYLELLRILQYFSEHQEIVASDYLRAVTLRAIRFCHTWESGFDILLLQRAFDSPSIAERLMATETWVFRYNDINVPEQFVNRLRNTLAMDTEIPNRLRKNYVLLLSRYADAAEIQVPAEYPVFDHLLQDTLSVVLSDSVDTLISSLEPLQRRNYYSGSRRDNTSQEYSL